MRFSVGTIEIDDDVRKAIKRESGQKGVAKREEAKQWVLDLVDRESRRITGKDDTPQGDVEPDVEANRHTPADEDPVG